MADPQSNRLGRQARQLASPEPLRLGDAQKITDAEGRIAAAEQSIADAEDTIADIEHEHPSPAGADGDGAVGIDRWRADRRDARTKQELHASERGSTETA